MTLSNKIFQNNLELLGSKYKEIQNRLQKIKPGDNYIPFLSENGEQNIKINGISLYSEANPSFFVDLELKKQKDIEKREIIILLGFKLGYYASKLYARLKKGAHLVIFEYDLNFFYYSLYNEQIRELLSSNNVHFIFETDINHAFAGFEKLNIFSGYEQVKIIENSNLKVLYKHFYIPLMEMLSEYLQNKTLNINTISFYGKDWAVNFIRNIPMLVRSPKISSFFEKNTDIPGVLVGAGPSLEKDIELLRQNQEKVFIVAVDSVYRKLAQAGIVPDIIVSIDASVSNYMDFEGVEYNGGVLMGDVYLYPTVFDKFEGDKFVFWQSSEQKEIYQYLNMTKENLSSGGSVSHSAFDLLHKMGFNPIIFLGQDLSYSEGRMHTKGYFYNDIWVSDSDFIRTTQTFLIDYMTGIISQQKFVENNSEETVFTTMQLDSYRVWFEEIISIVKESDKAAQFFNCAERGAKIKGAEYKPFGDIVEKYLLKDLKIKKQFRAAAAAATVKGKHAGSKKIVQVLREEAGFIESRLRELLTILRKAVSKYDQIDLRYVEKQLKQIQQQLYSKKMMYSLISLYLSESVTGIMRMMKREDNDDSERGKAVLAYKRTLEIYENMEVALSDIKYELEALQ